MCEICKTEKYERNPAKQPLSKTLIPIRPGQSIVMDIFHIDNEIFVTCIDRFSKISLCACHTFSIEFQRNIRTNNNSNYPLCEAIITDNEGIFTSHSSKAVFEKYKIRHVTTPIQHSTNNTQVKRVSLNRTIAIPAEKFFNAKKS